MKKIALEEKKALRKVGIVEIKKEGTERVSPNTASTVTSGTGTALGNVEVVDVNEERSERIVSPTITVSTVIAPKGLVVPDHVTVSPRISNMRASTVPPWLPGYFLFDVYI